MFQNLEYAIDNIQTINSSSIVQLDWNGPLNNNKSFTIIRSNDTNKNNNDCRCKNSFSIFLSNFT